MAITAKIATTELAPSTSRGGSTLLVLAIVPGLNAPPALKWIFARQLMEQSTEFAFVIATWVAVSWSPVALTMLLNNLGRRHLF